MKHAIQNTRPPRASDKGAGATNLNRSGERVGAVTSHPIIITQRLLLPFPSMPTLWEAEFSGFDEEDIYDDWH